MLTVSENGSTFMCVPVWAFSEAVLGASGLKVGSTFLSPPSYRTSLE